MFLLGTLSTVCLDARPTSQRIANSAQGHEQS